MIKRLCRFIPALILLALGGAVAWTLLNRQTVRLPGGTELSLAAVTQGPTNMFFPNGLWSKLLYRCLPMRGMTIGPIRLRPGRPLNADNYYRNGTVACPRKVVFWVTHRGATNAPPLPLIEENWFRDVRAEVVDEHGEKWEMRPGQSRFFHLRQNRLSGVSAWSFASLPRRGKTLKFRIYGRNESDTWDLLAEFKTPNPVSGRYPVWKPGSVPQTRQNGNVQVSLVNLISGVKAIHYLPDDQRPFTTALFKVTQDGIPTEAWLPDRLEAVDATGNEGSFQVIDYGATNGLVFYDAQGSSLSPSEVWRLRMRFSHEKDLSDDQVWTSPALSVPHESSLSTSISTHFQNYEVTMQLEDDTVDLKLSPGPANAQLRLVAIVDNRGLPVERLGGSLEDDGFVSILKLRPDVESIRVTISLCPSLDFEFLAKPALSH